MSQEHIATDPTTMGTNLTSKFLRKAKFRTVSAGHPEKGEFIPGLSKLPDETEVDTGAQSQSPLPLAPSCPSQTAVNHDQEGVKPDPDSQPDDIEMAPVLGESSQVDHEEIPTIIPEPSSPSPKVEMQSPSLSPKAEMQSPSPPSLAFRTTSSEPSVSDMTDIITSSPRSSLTDTEIRPPEAEEEEEEDTPMDTFTPFSPEELDQAKTLVLDLLGWGVDPEYLVTSGVSPEMIYRVFSDLNLELPENLEVSEELEAAAYSWGARPDFAQSVD